MEEETIIARKTAGQVNQYFGWTEVKAENARFLADKFIGRFQTVANSGRGWDYPYAGRYQRLLGLAEIGLAVVLRGCVEASHENIPFDDVR